MKHEKNISNIYLLAALILFVVVSSHANASEEISEKTEKLFSDTMKNYDDDVQVIAACDNRKRVIVEAYREGEIMDTITARKAAALLNGLIKYCSAEVIAVLPKNRIDALLSVDGEPFVTVDDTDMLLPVRLVHGSQAHTKREVQIRDAQVDKMISTGYKLFHSQITGTNGISCDMCHPDATNTHPETYPKFQTQLKKVALLRDMVNWCIEKPMEGKPLAHDSDKMKAIEAYILSTRKGVELDYGKH